HEPPDVAPEVRADGDDRGGEHHSDGETPVVADDEVVPEAQEPSRESHAPAGRISGVGTRRRPRATTAYDSARTKTIRARMAASAPGHDTPAPSPIQNIPNALSITPTPNFRAFSGTRLNGACTTAPAIKTTTRAATAASEARPTSCWLPPKVTTMNATSSP